MPAPVCRVLTVDDDPIFQELIKALLKKNGVADLYQAGNDAEAIVFLNEQSDFDLIISDLLMPQSDGAPLFRYMKDSSCQTPLLVVSSALTPTVAAVEALATSYNLNFMGVLPKPLRFKELENIISAAGLYFPKPTDSVVAG